MQPLRWRDKVEGLGKAEVLARYNAVVGVADVSLSVNRGEIFCIMGLSGSGKSTLVRHFNRLLEPTAGKIMIEGTDVMALGPKELQTFRNRKIGMVFQNFALMPHRSVLDNVAMPLEIRKVSKNDRLKQAASILDIVELGPGATSLPMSCRAACSNVWAWPARWRLTRTCC
jgi:glycine betaine/proline transport system ATP-binding protein